MKMMITVNALKAASHSMAQKDVRFYLNGVCLKFKADCHFGMAFGTDGHRLGCFRVDFDTDDTVQTLNVIIPADIIKSFLKEVKKESKIKFEVIDSKTGEYRLGDRIFKAIDGGYPDVSRVIPKKFSNEPSQLNPEYVLSAYQAMMDYRGTKNPNRFVLTGNGLDASMVHDGKNDAFVIVMPMRTDNYTPAGLPEQFA